MNARNKNDIKSLFIQNNIISLDRGSKRKPPSITISLGFPPNLKDSNEKAAELLDRLFAQMFDWRARTVLQELSLTWRIDNEEKA